MRRFFGLEKKKSGDSKDVKTAAQNLDEGPDYTGVIINYVNEMKGLLGKSRDFEGITDIKTEDNFIHISYKDLDEKSRKFTLAISDTGNLSLYKNVPEEQKAYSNFKELFPRVDVHLSDIQSVGQGQAEAEYDKRRGLSGRYR